MRFLEVACSALPASSAQVIDAAAAAAMLDGFDLGGAPVAEALAKLYAAYCANDAELLEINPLAMAPNGKTVDELVTHYREHDE